MNPRHFCLLLPLVSFACRGHAQEGATGVAPPSTSFVDRLGAQLYSVRASLEKDTPGTLAKIRQMGFSRVEIHKTMALTPTEFRQALGTAGLSAPSMMTPFDRLQTDLPGVIADAKALGARFVSCPWIPHEGTFDDDDERRTIAVFQAAGTGLAAAGLRFVSHIHGYELTPSATGEPHLDRMLKATQAGVVDFEMDVFYVTHGGGDPVRYLQTYPGRFPLLHLKDMKAGTPLNTSGKTDPEDTVAVGSGTIDFPRIIAAAERQGALLYFIEDESPHALTALPQSLAYLQGLRF